MQETVQATKVWGTAPCFQGVRSVLIWACILALPLVVTGSDCRAEDSTELMKVVKAYFDAEVSGDSERVWELLAPSSYFKQAYSYPFYVELLKRHPVRVKRYRIREIVEIVDNQDRKKLPSVERIATVKVHVVIGDGDGKDTEQTRVFTFLEEGGTWYKG
jgi:hypothetical protein